MDQSRRSIPAWGPINSAGSLLAKEVNPEVDDRGLESVPLHEKQDDSNSEDVTNSCWICISAGGLNVDPASLPDWYVFINVKFECSWYLFKYLFRLFFLFFFLSSLYSRYRFLCSLKS